MDKERLLEYIREHFTVSGEAGRLILRDVNHTTESRDRVVCIIDDNPNKWGRYIEGVQVVGGRDKILEGVEKYKIQK